MPGLHQTLTHRVSLRRNLQESGEERKGSAKQGNTDRKSGGEVQGWHIKKVLYVSDVNNIEKTMTKAGYTDYTVADVPPRAGL